MSDKKAGVQTSVQTTEADLSIFDLGMSSESVMTPENKQKANIFSANGPDLQFLDKSDDQDDPDDDNDDPNKGTPPPAPKGKKPGEEEEEEEHEEEEEEEEEDDDPLNLGKGNAGAGDGSGEGDDDPNKGGRPKTDKNGLVDLTNQLIEAKLIVPFEDDKPIEKYTLQDFKELFQANFDDQREQTRKDISKEFWESMPQEVQYIGQYLANGGQDLKQLFSALAQVEQTRELDPEDDNDQEMITREYLRATQFGTEEEISDEIASWKDLNKLGQKAKQFKPKLDKMKEERVAQQLAAQEAARKKQQDAARNYMKSVYDVLEPGQLNGVKLDKKTQGMLYTGLVQASYPSVTGRQTNLLGHLMEKYQFVEPNHGLVAEVLWLLADPEGYKQKLREGAASDAQKKTVKLLKTEEQRKVASAAAGDDDDDKGGKGRKLSRPVNVFTGKR